MVGMWWIDIQSLKLMNEEKFSMTVSILDG